jgi:hypothetical protein
MAAKNLKEAILIPLTEKGVYLTAEQTQRLEGELKDYIAHQIMIHLGPMSENNREDEIILRAFFCRIFKK